MQSQMFFKYLIFVCVREPWHRQTIFEYAKIAFTCISDAFQFVWYVCFLLSRSIQLGAKQYN